MVKDPSVRFKTYNPFFIHRPRDQYALVSRELSKTFQFTFDKRIVLDDYSTLPYGAVHLQQPVAASIQSYLLGGNTGWKKSLDYAASSDEEDHPCS